MSHKIRIHYDNSNGFLDPVLWVWVSDGATLEREVEETGRDEFGVYFDLQYNRSSFHFLVKDGKGEDGPWEDKSKSRTFHQYMGEEIWTMADRHNVYTVRPAKPAGFINDYYKKIKNLIPEEIYLPDTDVSGLGVVSMLGAHTLKDGSVLFSFFHPRAARVYLTGNFNNWQCPGNPRPKRGDFVEMELHRGFYYLPNIWLARIKPGWRTKRIEYKFFLQGGSADMERYAADPYTRLFSDDYKFRNCVVVNPASFKWTDQGWKTPDVKDLILYELNVYGFTDNDSDIPAEIQGTFKGVTRRIKEGYFSRLGVTALALMPTAEVPVKRGLGYEPCTFMAVEKDFGSPEDFKEMINTAHNHGLAVIIDQVFNHTSNDFNPLWDLIDDGSGRGGLYFAGETMWGNKVATGRDEVDNMLVDSCKMFIKEYHVDGFRFDATHSYFLNHRLLLRIAHEIKDTGFKPDVVLIAENLPNEEDINLEGYNGYAQWCNVFHDKLKALLREGDFEHTPNDTGQIGTMFYYAKDKFAAHTNNVVNYCESHDENSVQYEAATGGAHLQDESVKERKARLGLFSTIVALGQPMIYMGQEFGVERERNRIRVPWDKYDEKTNNFYRWTCGLINLRKRYENLKISGYNPIEEGKFEWLIGPWFEGEKGGAKRVIGWKTKTGREGKNEEMFILINFEGHDIPVMLDTHRPGRWIKLADLDRVSGDTALESQTGNEEENRDMGTIVTNDGVVRDFVLPPYSGFIYRYDSPTVN